MGLHAILVLFASMLTRGWSPGNSLPRHIRPTLPTIPTNSQLLDTTALPFGLIIQPFATLRYDEAPIPVVSSFVSGQSAFDQQDNSDESVGPPRCEKCRGYINPWARWQDGGRRWGCNLCGNANTGELKSSQPRSELILAQSPTCITLISDQMDRD